MAKLVAEGAETAFTRVCTSSTDYSSSDLASLTAISGTEQENTEFSVARENDTEVAVSAIFSNTSLTDGYYLRTIGLYAEDPDDGEILYAVAVESSGSCYMPAYNGSTVSGASVRLVVAVGNADSVTLVMDDSAVATAADIANLQSQINSIGTNAASANALSSLSDNLSAVSNNVASLNSSLGNYMATATYDPAGGASQVAFASDLSAVTNNVSSLSDSLSAMQSNINISTNSICAGVNAVAGYYATIIGCNASANRYGTAVGYNASAQNRGIAVGGGCNASGLNSVAVGYYANSSENATACGFNATANAANATAIGWKASATAENSTAIGQYSSCTNENGMQLGAQDSLSSLTCKVSLTVTSDIRDKADVTAIDDGAMEFLGAIMPIRYVYNGRELYIDKENMSDSDRALYETYGMCPYDTEAHSLGTLKGERIRVGVSAQEVQSALEEVYGDSGYGNLVNDNLYDFDEDEIPEGVESRLAVNYDGFIPFIIKALQELAERIAVLEGEKDG